MWSRNGNSALTYHLLPTKRGNLKMASKTSNAITLKGSTEIVAEFFCKCFILFTRLFKLIDLSEYVPLSIYIVLFLRGSGIGLRTHVHKNRQVLSNFLLIPWNKQVSLLCTSTVHLYRVVSQFTAVVSTRIYSTTRSTLWIKLSKMGGTRGRYDFQWTKNSRHRWGIKLSFLRLTYWCCALGKRLLTQARSLKIHLLRSNLY